MDNSKLISHIREDLETINPRASSSDVQSAIFSITRSANRLQAKDIKATLLVRKLITDLMLVYNGEVKYFNFENRSNTNNTRKMVLSDSFFRSFEILKADLQKALDKISN